MTPRRMPSGQGPARRGPRRSPSIGPRVARQRTNGTRGPDRSEPTEIRPSVLRRAAGPARRMRAPRSPGRRSGRAAALGLLFVALVLAYAYPVRVYLDQESQIDQMVAAQQAQQRRITELTEQLSRWDDDEYVTAQARRRLHYVRAGERVYVVGDESGAAPGNQPHATTSSWLDQVWSNVNALDHPNLP